MLPFSYPSLSPLPSFHDALPILRPLTLSVAWMLALHLSLLAASGLAAHGRLAADRPSPRRLADFYLAVDRKSTRLNSCNLVISYTVFSLPKTRWATVSHQTMDSK